LSLIISCNQSKKIEKKDKDEIIKENISNYLKNLMNDPKSFEFVSMRIKKQIPVKERVKTINEKSLKEVLNLTGKDDRLYKQFETEYNFLKKIKDSNKIAVFYVDFIARGKNKFNATITNKYSATVLNDKNYTVINLHNK